MRDIGRGSEPPGMSEASRKLRVLLVEDSEHDAELMLRELVRDGFRPEVRRLCSRTALQAALGEGGWDVVISDYMMPQFTGLDALSCLKESGVDIPFILVSGTVGEDLAVEALKAGANSFIVKPVAFDAFVEAVRQVGLYWLLLNQEVMPSPGRGSHA